MRAAAAFRGPASPVRPSGHAVNGTGRPRPAPGPGARPVLTGPGGGTVRASESGSQHVMTRNSFDATLSPAPCGSESQHRRNSSVDAPGPGVGR
jgi:hypothetical protein